MSATFKVTTRTMFCTRSRQQGFTLLEILVTLAIVAIITVFAVPSMQGVLGGSVLSATSNDLVYSLQSARSEAIKRITPVHLCPSKNPASATAKCDGKYTDGWIVFVDEDRNNVLSINDTVILRNEALSPSFTVVPDERFKKRVVFSLAGSSVNSSGIPIGGDITVEHASDSEKRVVSIAASGRISSSTPAVTVAAAGKS